MLLTLLLLTWGTVLAFFLRRMTQAHKFWSSRGVPHLKPVVPFIGNLWTFFMTGSFPELVKTVLDQHPDAPLIGIYLFTNPLLVVRDIDLIEHVMIKDFHNFTDRGFDVDGKKAPWEYNLFTMSGKKWRLCRNKFSPMFTTSKIRRMFPQMQDLAKVLIKVIGKNKESIDLKDTFLQYTLDVVSSTAFGINTKTLCQKEGGEFTKRIRLAHKTNFRFWVVHFLYEVCPWLAKQLWIRRLNPDVTLYFSGIVKEAMQLRKNGVVKRDDFLQLMVALQEKGFLEVELEDEDDTHLDIVPHEDRKTEHLELTEDLMIAQALLFLIVGLNSTSSVLMYLCYQLAIQPDIQDQVRNEVKEVFASTGELGYDAVGKMHFLDMCFKETMRLHNPAPFITRISCREYTFPGTELTIPTGTRIIIPSTAVHMDPELYPEPEKFDPERFAQDTFHPPCAYLPFGDGPRICIAWKFAMTEMKCVLAKLLLCYRIQLNPRSAHLKPFQTINMSDSREKVLFDMQQIEIVEF